MTHSPPGDGLAIDLKQVAKVYKGKVHALQGIDMCVRRGEVFGLLGPNGAGKSTLVKIMMTVIRPTHAQGTILGSPVGHKPTLRRVGYLPENHRFPRYLTGRQTLEFFAALSDVNRSTRKRRAGELLETVGMKDWADKKVSTYSKGMMQRIGLAQALAADPDLVVLDEPTDGVDPVGRRDIRGVMSRLREQGKTVFINSHLLSELEMLCDRVAILVKGKVARQGTVDELTETKQYYEIEIAPSDPIGGPSGAGLRERVMTALPGYFTQSVPNPAALAPPPLPLPGRPPLPAPSAFIDRGRVPGDSGNPWVEFDGQAVRIGTTDAAAVQPLLDALRNQALVIRRLQPFRQSLEDLFMEAVTDPLTGQSLTPGADRPRGFAVGAAPGVPRPAIPQSDARFGQFDQGGPR
jgi:ABC-2 type transport system ATP-binding protein